MAFLPASSLVNSLCRSESLVSSFTPPGLFQRTSTTCLRVTSSRGNQRRLTEGRVQQQEGKCHSQVLSKSFLPAMRKALWKEKVDFLWLWFLGTSADVLVSWHSEHEPGFRPGFESCCLPSQDCRKFNSLTAAGLLPVLGAHKVKVVIRQGWLCHVE